MDISHEGRDITIQRTNGSGVAGAPFKNLLAVYTGTAEFIKTLTPDTAGEQLTGVSEHVFERTAYMPMFGCVNAFGSAFLAVYDTPWDASYDYADGKAYPIWRTSLGTLRYQRRMIYSFFKGDYNDIAKRYRAYVKNKGRLITLKASDPMKPDSVHVYLKDCPGAADEPFRGSVFLEKLFLPGHGGDQFLLGFIQGRFVRRGDGEAVRAEASEHHQLALVQDKGIAG